MKHNQLMSSVLAFPIEARPSGYEWEPLKTGGRADWRTDGPSNADPYKVAAAIIKTRKRAWRNNLHAQSISP